MSRFSLLLLLVPVASIADEQKEAKSRTFLFTYQTKVSGLPQGKSASIWLPMPSSSEEQKVSIVRRALPPTAKINREKKYGNRVLFVKAPAGKDGTITL